MDNKIEKEKRLLTEKEKEYIIECYNKIKWSNYVIIFGVGFIVYVLLSCFWGLIVWGMSEDIAEGIRQGFGCFVLMFCFTALCVTKHFWDLHIVIKRTKANTMYAKEAIYDETTGKYHIVYLEMYKKGKLKYDGYNLLVREPLQKGDKVIVLQMRGQAWVYKARE